MRLAGWAVVVVVLVDQASKYLVVQRLDLATRQLIEVAPPWLSLRMAWNRGVNFGLFANDAGVTRWVLVAVALAISAWVWWWVARERQSRKLQLAAGLLVGGALGNVVDRLIYGAVADFINIAVPGIANPWSFNIADVAIFAGALGLVAFAGGGQKPRDAREELR
ncbi:MAG: signal peptidase II [Phaeovulum sp.]|uniref:signal peptidase II n=1 Tax=Phaeovulum sp. TaxID=2934796 RepID=UPI0027301683|nr:signal peptidase II [Phaeovulum sp.]MDP2061885.1 signal peptidase II [Phaeovulum sp.]